MCINQVNELQVRNNILFNCTGEGIAPHSGNNINLTENLMTYCGISGINDDYSALSTYSIDTSNKVNGKSVYYHLDSNNLDNADYLNPGQIILVNCNNSNISEINISYTSSALALFYCDNVSILDCNFSDNGRGINLDYSNNIDISRNIVDRNRNAGIYLAESNHNSISLNNISNNYDDLSPSLPWQGQPSLLRNEIGISIRDSSNNNTIDGNTVNTNKIGINIFGGANNTIKRNNITENYEYGVLLENYSSFIATLNLVYWNSFNSNGINAQDNGTTNMWDNGTLGNSWDDYSGKDANDDGIGDTLHTIPGSAGSQDNYPIFGDALIISIDSPIHINNNWTATESTYSWCTGSGTSNDPYIIQDLIIDGEGSGSCILIENSDVYFEIENCTLYNSGVDWGDAGIRLNNVDNGYLNDNNCSSNVIGMEIEDCAYNNISGNIVSDNLNSGIHVKSCSNITLLGNSADNNVEIGLYIEICTDINITDNGVDNNGWVGIYFSAVNSSIIVKNTANDNGDMGINLERSSNNYINENTVDNNANRGINMETYSSYNEIVDNTATSNRWVGILLGGNSAHNLVMSNNISDQMDGIYLQAPNNTISENDIYGNGKGIVLSGFKVALSNNITRNIIRENGNGIFFDDDCSQNIIEGNKIYDNSEVGVRILTGSHHNLIFNNSFTNNLLSHAYDYGESNRWDNGTLGNYWEDYSGDDANDDGIGDTPYDVIGTSASAQDNFPIWDDGPEPVEQGIPGYNLFFLLGTISVVAIVLSTKLKKCNK